jgi:hypothetical protein
MTILLIVLAITLLSLALPERQTRRSQRPFTTVADRDDQRIRDELRFRSQS